MYFDVIQYNALRSKDMKDQTTILNFAPLGSELAVALKTITPQRHHRMSWNDTLDKPKWLGMSAGLRSDRPDDDDRGRAVTMAHLITSG